MDAEESFIKLKKQNEDLLKQLTQSQINNS